MRVALGLGAGLWQRLAQSLGKTGTGFLSRLQLQPPTVFCSLCISQDGGLSSNQ